MCQVKSTHLHESIYNERAMQIIHAFFSNIILKQLSFYFLRCFSVLLSFSLALALSLSLCIIYICVLLTMSAQLITFDSKRRFIIIFIIISYHAYYMFMFYREREQEGTDGLLIWVCFW